MRKKLTQKEAVDAYERIARFNSWERNGCCMHILLADGNIDDDDALFCLDEALNTGHEECLAIAQLCVRMSKTQRKKAGRL